MLCGSNKHGYSVSFTAESNIGNGLTFIEPYVLLYYCLYIAPFEVDFCRLEIRNIVCNWEKYLFSHLRKLYQILQNKLEDCIVQNNQSCQCFSAFAHR